MNDASLQSEVVSRVSEQTGVPRQSVEPSSRLLHDLGMDGDDAVDFFNAVHERFGTDLTHLYEHWGEHFGPEGFSCWNGLIIVPAALIGGLLAGAAGVSTLGGALITIALLGVVLWAMRRWGPPDRMVPITIRDVVTAVELGAWPRRPDA